MARSFHAALTSPGSTRLATCSLHHSGRHGTAMRQYASASWLRPICDRFPCARSVPSQEMSATAGSSTSVRKRAGLDVWNVTSFNDCQAHRWLRRSGMFVSKRRGRSGRWSFRNDDREGKILAAILDHEATLDGLLQDIGRTVACSSCLRPVESCEGAVFLLAD